MAITTKKLIAEEYVVSSSVTLMTQSLSSGSTVFGDSLDDTHRMTGSLFVSGGIATDGSAGGTAGDGGSALASTITGNSVLRAGGGGAGAYGGGNNFPLGGGGGAGTGEYGYSGANNGTAATANTGSGGGGSPGDNTATGGAGGSGVVILRYDSSVTATYTSGVQYTTAVVGGDKVDTITSTSNNSQTVTFS